MGATVKMARTATKRKAAKRRAATPFLGLVRKQSAAVRIFVGGKKSSILPPSYRAAIPLGPGAELDAEIAKLKSGELTPYDGGQAIDFSTDTHASPKPWVADGVIKDDPFARVERYRIKNVRGIAAKATFTGSEFPPEATGIAYVSHNEITFCYRGIVTELADSRIAHNVVEGARDYALHVGRAPGGHDAANVQSLFGHYYGAHKAAFVESSCFNSVGDEFADAAYGYHGVPSSWNAGLTSPTIFHCWIRSLKIEAQTDIGGRPFIDVPTKAKIHSDTTGLELSAPTSLIGGRIAANWWNNPNDTQHAPCVAVLLLRKGADRCRFQTNVDLKPGLKDERLAWVKEPIYGGDFAFNVTGIDERDLLLDIHRDAADSRATNWIFQGPGLDKKHVSLPPNLHKSNTVTVWDTQQGKTEQVWPK